MVEGAACVSAQRALAGGLPRQRFSLPATASIASTLHIEAAPHCCKPHFSHVFRPRAAARAAAAIERRRYNPWASLVQANPNESKEKSLDLFGFLWPNRAFSKGYRGKNKKVWLRLNSRPGLRDSPLRGTS